MMVDQVEFRTALLDPARGCPDGLVDDAGRPAGRRFNIYRNNVAVSLTEALQTAFPVVAKLLGDKNFRMMAGVFLRRHPPSSPLMMFYGAEMPEFLREFEPTAKLGYLPDVARLELAMRGSYHAADAAGVPPRLLQDMPADVLLSANVSLAPSIRLVRSDWPLHAIWRYNTEQNAPKPRMAKEDVLVVRHELDPSPHLLLPGAGQFIEALLNDRPFGEAHEAALSACPEFDLAGTLGLLVGAEAITNIGD